MLAFADASTAGADWLAAADAAPDRVHLWWANAGIALLAVGAQWDVIKTGEGHGHRAIATGALGGPIMCDPVFGHMHFLVAVGTSAAWDVADTECLGADCWLKVPTPGRTTPPGVYWLQPPDGSGTLVDHMALRSALLRATEPKAGAQ